LKARASEQSEASVTGGVDHRLAKAFAHPLRVEILTILDQRVASPNEMANELNEGLSLVSYHVKVLREFDCIELVSTRPRRGATEHFYRAIQRPQMTDHGWKGAPEFARGRISDAGLKMIVEDAMKAIEAGTFDKREDRHLSRTHLVLDRQGWDKVSTLLNETREQALDAHAESAERMATSDEEGILAKVALLHFESPDPE
jgi:DNA-binding transcriptional ArsR family regulator